MKKKPKSDHKPYVDPFLFEVGFFKDMNERQKMLDKLRKLNARRDRDKP